MLSCSPELFLSCCVGINGTNITSCLLIDTDGAVKTVLYELIINFIHPSVTIILIYRINQNSVVKGFA